MIVRRDVFQAIADPTRRRIISRIAGGAMNLNAVADSFDMSRQAVANHIKILTECGLVTIRQQGRERFCEAKLDQLAEVTDWVEESKKLWAGRFNALDNFLAEIQAKPAENGNQ
ncbi:ArsR/SmtB family transcription factor [Mucilaginibacter psychrotolerans]|uniref:Transcriptional regulator n=1 Tax=Mucilaginibacter psychrotolerans TaxID=1524096 RepID=A0A4Y8SB29_9SPHI|nr:metalloregulator ArsR/SmtB family transcription factor [Mucilaginibacter psychrotolerans]TFF35777.1 transcriptional regulator [Mucilaginibacter psychrotolerans]